MNRRTYSLFAILILVILLAACGAAATTPLAQEEYREENAPSRPAAGRAPMEGETLVDADMVAAQGGALQRMVVRTAQLSIIVEDVEKTLPLVSDLVGRLEGYIVQSSSYRTATDRLAATVTLRVPAERYDEAMAALRALAYKVQSETMSGEDVTDQYVNLEARLRALQATETELLALLGEVRQSEGNAQEKAQAILDIYNRLTEVRSQIETIQGQMQYLEQMSAMATITVELYPRDPEIAQPVIEEGYNPLRTLGQAGRALVAILQWLLNALIWLVVTILPILLILAAPVLLVVWLARRRRGKKGEK